MIKRISGAGCCLLDYLYTDSDFNAPAFRSCLSEKPGDGGLVPGQLVFSSDLAEFSGMSEDACLDPLTGGRVPDTANMGGPGVVPMVHASQTLGNSGWEVAFTGPLGNDSVARELREHLARYPVDFSEILLEGPAPTTIVLSDPRYHQGAGERTFINRLGVADRFNGSVLDEEFFRASIFLWGGTGLVPPMHANLTSLVKKGRDAGGLNVVGTVYDFRNESLDPYGPWPLGDPDEPAYPWIDLLIMDLEEAKRLSGTNSLEEASAFMKESGCGSFIITCGAGPLCLYAGDRGPFLQQKEVYLPVSPYVDEDLKAHPEKRGDTTGCGDNFVGGVIVSLARQMEDGTSLDLVDAAVEGICSGGLALYSRGGCRVEAYPGERETLLAPIRENYLLHTLQEALT